MLDVRGDNRQLKGLEIAATAKLQRKGTAWLVPSQSGKGRYTVVPDADSPHCSCPDHEEGGHKCKHLFAVEYVIQREQNADGSTTVTETLFTQQTVQRVYPQNWRAYTPHRQTKRRSFRSCFAICAAALRSSRSRKADARACAFKT